MSPPSSLGRRIAAAGLCLAVLFGSGCEDERESSTGPTPGFLDGEGLFGSALVTAAILRYQNETAMRVLEVLENNLSTPIFETGCAGNGQRIITRDAQNSSRFRIQHGTASGSYLIECNSDLRLTLNGDMYIEFLETSPGLHYTVQMPFNHLTGDPEGMVYSLPTEAGGAILDVTTPGHTINAVLDPYGVNGFLDCVLVDDSVQQTGTVRIEERIQSILLVEELEMEYSFDEALSPPFSVWPGGRYEIASFASVGPFGGGISTSPVDVTFDGLGGASFPLGDRTCDINLQTGSNPCEDL